MASRQRFPLSFIENDLSKNGVFLVFEKDEASHLKERIVGVGTHMGENYPNLDRWLAASKSSKV